MRKTLVIGGGEIGRAVKHILIKSGNDALVWDKDPGRSELEESLESILEEPHIVIGAVPAGAVREVATKIAESRGDHFFISLAKGMDPETSEFMHEILADLLGERFALLHGPMIAEEIEKDLPAAAVLASPYPFEEAREVFEEGLLFVRESDDVAGIAISAVLKNIYSILLGVADALALGANVRGILMTGILHEMEDVVEELGGNKESVYSLAGMGDLIATGTSEHSANKSMGEEIVTKGVCSLESEGCRSLPSLLRRVDSNKYMFIKAIAHIVEKPKDAEDVVMSLL